MSQSLQGNFVGLKTLSQKLFSHWILVYSSSEVVIVRKSYPLKYCFIILALESYSGKNLILGRHFCSPYLFYSNLSCLGVVGGLKIPGKNSPIIVYYFCS